MRGLASKTRQPEPPPHPARNLGLVGHLEYFGRADLSPRGEARSCRFAHFGCHPREPVEHNSWAGSIILLSPRGPTRIPSPVASETRLQRDGERVRVRGLASKTRQPEPPSPGAELGFGRTSGVFWPRRPLPKGRGAFVPVRSGDVKDIIVPRGHIGLETWHVDCSAGQLHVSLSVRRTLCLAVASDNVWCGSKVQCPIDMCGQCA